MQRKQEELAGKSCQNSTHCIRTASHMYRSESEDVAVDGDPSLPFKACLNYRNLLYVKSYDNDDQTIFQYMKGIIKDKPTENYQSDLLVFVLCSLSAVPVASLLTYLALTGRVLILKN